MFKSFVHMIKISEHSTITFLHSSLHLCEACKHGFTHSILVGVRWWEFIWASFNAQTGAFGPQWSLLGKAKTIIRDDILDTGAPQAAVLIAMWAEISTLACRFHLLRGSGQQTRGSLEDKKSLLTEMGTVMPCWWRPRPLPSCQPIACNILLPILSLVKPSLVGCSKFLMMVNYRC